MPPKPVKRAQPNRFGDIISGFLAVALLAIFPLAPDGASGLIIWPCLAVFYWLFATSLQRPDRVHPEIPTHLTIEVLFLVFYYLIFYHAYQLYVLGLYDLTSSAFLRYSFFSESNRAVIAATLGLVAFCWGIRRQARAAPRGFETSQRSVSDDYEHMPLLVTGLLAICMLAYELAGWRSAGEGRYTQGATGGALAEGVYLLIIMLSMISYALGVARISSGRGLPPTLWLAIALSSYWAVRILLAGDRNGFLLIALVAVAGALTFKLKASRLALGALVVGGLLLYNTVEIYRSTYGAPDRNVASIAATHGLQTNAANSSFNISTVTLRASIETVPERVDYGYGVYKLIGFSGIVPLVRGVIISPDQIYTTTSKVLGKAMLGPHATWGVGTNIISDIYIDFGIVGVPILMAAVGLFAATIRNRTMLRPGADKQIVFYLLVLSQLAQLSRYSLDFPVRILVWAALLFWTYDVIMSRQRERNSGARLMVRKVTASPSTD